MVSFPRTGSHWLRMLSELYFERPTLVRPFYYPNSKDYLYIHHHDVDLSLERKNVIYLYREPIATIYSQLKYHNRNINSESCIREMTHGYGSHIDKWLCQESFTTKKTVLSYENLQADLENEFRKLTDHLGHPLDPKRLAEISAQITKNEVKLKTMRHDDKVINQCADYTDQRVKFSNKYAPMIRDILFENHPGIASIPYINIHHPCS